MDGDLELGGVPGKRTLTQGLPPSLRRRAEASTGADLSTVRVHDDPEAHQQAAGLGAMAYAIGHDIWFGAGQYRPGTEVGDRLIAHEVAHTVQQGPQAAARPQAKLEVSGPGDAAEVEADHAIDAILAGTPAQLTRGLGASVACAPWGSAYGSQDPGTATGNGTGGTQTASQYEQSINQPGGPVLAPASDHANTGGRPVRKSAFRLTKDELLDILRAAQGKVALDYMLGQGASKVPAENRAHAEQELAKYVDYCQRAFDTMMIDTIEAQALFLAHAAGETALTKLTEGQTNRTNFESDPAKVEVSTSTASTTGQRYADGTAVMDGPMRYGQPQNGHGPGVDPNHAIDGRNEDSFDQTFIGRGPIQVTFRTSYVQTLAFMSKRSADLKAEAATADPEQQKELLAKAAELDAAIDAIKAEPRNAADPKYAFLFSAAYMQMSPMVRNSAGGFTNAGMTGGARDPAGDKKKRAYDKAVEILSAHKAADEHKVDNRPEPGCLPGTVAA